MKRLGAWWFAPAPPERLAVLRVAILGFGFFWIASRWIELNAVAHLPPSQFAPVGVTRLLFERGHPIAPGLVLAIAGATLALLGLAIAGALYRVTAPLAAAGVLFTLTYRNSWGMVFHTENLLVVHAIALSILPAADAWSFDAWRNRAAPRVDAAGYGWACNLLALLTACTYVLAGVAKLRIAGFDWIDGELLRNQIAIDNLRKAVYGSGIAPFAELFLEHPRALTAFTAMTLAIELGAPLALLDRRIAWAWALGAWGFHTGVILLMNIWFPYPLSWIAFLPLFAVERPVRGMIARLRR